MYSDNSNIKYQCANICHMKDLISKAVPPVATSSSSLHMRFDNINYAERLTSRGTHTLCGFRWLIIDDIIGMNQKTFIYHTVTWMYIIFYTYPISNKPRHRRSSSSPYDKLPQ